MADNGRVELADAIRALRAELVRARLESEDEPLRFRADKVELEFDFTIGKEASADAGIRFWVISLGATGAVTSAQTHRVKLTLTPETRAGTAPYVHGKEGRFEEDDDERPDPGEDLRGLRSGEQGE
jgi:hypothetical protein